MKRSFIVSIVVAAVLLGGLAYFLHYQNPDFDLWGLLIGNVALALISIFSFYTISKGLRSENNNVFMRAKYTGTLVKFFSCLALLLLYIFLHHQKVHKPSIFLFLGMYVVYSALEAVPLSRLAKKQ
jgi:Kef-type K+ transport system membrane component KefB